MSTGRFYDTTPTSQTIKMPIITAWMRKIGLLFLLCGFFPGAVLAEPAHGIEMLLNTAEGKTLRLADFHGKVVVVNFWATWCPPCLAEIPEFIKFQKDYADKGVVVVGINFMDKVDQKRLKKFKDDNKINYPILYGSPGKMAKLAKDLGGVFGLPVSKLLNQKGQLVSSHVGGLTEKTLRELVDPLLAQSGSKNK